MMKTKHYLIALLVVSSCTESSDRESQYRDKSKPHVQTKVDTVSQTTPKSNEVKISATEYASQIISGQIKPSDNEETFAWLDSLHSSNRDTRNYAFKVYKAMDVNSDGALSEAMCGYIKEYFSSYPKEFLDNYKTLSDQEKASIAESVAFEFYARGPDYIENLDKYFRKIQTDCEDCTQTDKVILTKIRSILEAKVRQMLE